MLGVLWWTLTIPGGGTLDPVGGPVPPTSGSLTAGHGVGLLPGLTVWSAGVMAVLAGLLFGLVMGGMYLFRRNFLHPKDRGENE